MQILIASATLFVSWAKGDSGSMTVEVDWTGQFPANMHCGAY